VLDLAHHAFSRAIDIGVTIEDFGSTYLLNHPVEFQAMGAVLKNEINLFDGNGFLPARLFIVIVHSIDEASRLAFLPNAEGEF